MITAIAKRFIKNFDDVNEPKVRESYGMFSSWVGIVCNIILFVTKFIVGTISGAISIVSDGFNNLSDCASCVVTMFAYKMTSKPADKDHPFGHGRMEYLTSLALSMLIMLVAFELLRGSIDKIIHPSKITFSVIALSLLLVSMLIKLFMYRLNMVLGKRVNSCVMEATAKDSISDVFATGSTVIALVAALFTDIPVDGIMGIVVSVLIMKTGMEIAKDTVDQLLGKPADKEIVEALAKIVDESWVSMGMHDLIIHSYGPGNLIGSIHVEVDCHKDIMEIHDAIDELERDIYEELGIMLTIHMDPIDVGNEKTESCKNMIKDIINNISNELSFHDFRIVSGPTHTNLVFDVVLPYECGLTEIDVKQAVAKELDKKEEKYYAVMTFDKKMY